MAVVAKVKPHPKAPSYSLRPWTPRKLLQWYVLVLFTPLLSLNSHTRLTDTPTSAFALGCYTCCCYRWYCTTLLPGLLSVLTSSEPISPDAPIVGPLRPPSTSPSPAPEPGAPPLLVGKFSHFRNLKAQGVHFNEKLLRSSSLRNPNLLQKLTAFAGFDDADQYSTNLPSDVWDPTAFKEEAFVEQLAASQIRIAEAREAAKLEHAREKLEFVSSVRVQTPPPPQEPPSKERLGTSAAERVMKGLDRETKSVLSRRDRDDGTAGRRDDRGRRRDDERDRRRGDDYRDRRRYDDKEWGRRRSRSGNRERRHG